MKAMSLQMSEKTIRWSPIKQNLGYFQDNLQIRLRQLEPNRPLRTDQINGDEVYVRRVDSNIFQCGVVAVCARRADEQSRGGGSITLSQSGF